MKTIHMNFNNVDPGNRVFTTDYNNESSLGRSNQHMSISLPEDDYMTKIRNSLTGANFRQNESPIDRDVSDIIENSVAKHKHRTKFYWKIRKNKIALDSESESTPLLSSGSHTSSDRVMFHDSETSNTDSDLDRRHTVFISRRDQSNFNFNSRKLPAVNRINLFDPTPPKYRNDFLEMPVSPQLYGLHKNIDMVFKDERHKSMSIPSIPMKTIANAFPKMSQSEDCQTLSTPLLKDILPKQSSIVTIFSIWNTILGSSLLTMPWGITMAGLFPGSILILLMSGLCLYTAYRLLQVHKYHGGQDKVEVPELCQTLLGSFPQFIAKISSLTVLLGANIAYWILMSNFLYNSVNFVYDKITGFEDYSSTMNDTSNSKVLCSKKVIFDTNHIIVEPSFDTLGPAWDLHKTVPIFLGIVIFPLLNFNSTTFFTKFNSLGTVAILYLVILVSVKSWNWGINMDEVLWETSWTLKPTFPALCGILTMSFFIHNIIITIMQHNRNQSKNGRDLSIAFILVTTTYVIIGVTFYICFPLAKSCIEDNFLNNFQKLDTMTVGARIVLFFQLLTVFPLIMYMLRLRLLTSIFHSKKPSRINVAIVNLSIVIICILFSRFLPFVGTVIRFTGAISGLVYIFTLPSLLYLAILCRKGEASIFSVMIHSIIPFIGIANLIAQLFVSS